ncbi:MAG: ABC transporter permease [Gluconacetobacter liquefaciens]
MMRRRDPLAGSLLGRMGLVFFYIVLLAPIAVVIPVSMDGAALLEFPPRHFSLRWYAAVFHDDQILSACLTSVELGLAVTMLSLAIGLPAALALDRRGWPGRAAVAALFAAPLILPAVVLGLGLLMALIPLGMMATFPGLALAHLIVVLPYVVRLLGGALAARAPGLDDAAMTLGAGAFDRFRLVTLPLLRGPIIAAAALAFLTSFDEAVVSLFLTGPGLITLPVRMFVDISSRSDPRVAALSVLVLGATALLLFVVEKLAGLARATT